MVPKRKEKRLVLDDRTTQTACDLVPVNPGGVSGSPHSINDLLIVAPRVGVELGVSDTPYPASVKLIGSRTGQDLNLPVAASEFGIYWCEDDAEFTNHVRMD